MCIHGKACHTILRSLCSLTNRVPLPPLCRGQNKTPRDNLLINPPLKLTMAAAPLSSFRPKRSGVEKSHAPNDRKADLRPLSFRPKRSGEISPSDGTSGITAKDLSTQSIIKAFSLCPIPTRSPARDDGVGGRPSRHFDRSGAEWRNLTPQMTKTLPPIPVISTVAERSGEISFL